MNIKKESFLIVSEHMLVISKQRMNDNDTETHFLLHFADSLPACGSHLQHLPDAQCLGFHSVVQHAH